MIKTENLTFAYSEIPLYKDVSFAVNKGQKVGLVGPNGSGKSTLFKILTGKEEGYKGKITLSGTYAEVPQEIKYEPVMEKCANVMEYIDPDGKIEKHSLKKFLTSMESESDLFDNPNKMSGGQKTKLALARALLSEPEILLLDEPTNFMDISGKKFVMDFLAHYEGTVVVISHDLELMDKAIDKVLYVNSQKKSIEEYKGNYSTFVRLKAEKDELLRKQVLVKQKHIKQMEEGLKKMVRFTSGKGVRRRVQQQRRIEKEKQELPDLPKEIKKINMKLPEPAKMGEIPIRVLGIQKSYYDLTVLKNISFSIVRGDRVVFIGPNGAGKSTLIKIMVGILKADSGEVIKNESLKLGYYSQEFETFDFSKSVIDTFCSETGKDEKFARSFLGCYMFMGDKVYQKVGTLSGGEKTRLSIAILTGTDNNMLILDEPTTYLDVTSQRVILEALKNYKGTMIIVSHTEEFIKDLKPHKAFLFPEQRYVFWDDQYLNKVGEI